MDQEIEIISSETRKEKIKNFFINNKRLLIIVFSLIIILLMAYFVIENYKEKQKK